MGAEIFPSPMAFLLGGSIAFANKENDLALENHFHTNIKQLTRTNFVK